MAYFELRSARDMFDKAEREFAKLSADFTIDNVFNFFVTAYHIQDYVRRSSSVTWSDVDSFLADIDIKDCRDLCDKGKHLQLTRRADPITHISSGALGGAPLNTISINGGGKWLLLTDDRQVEIESLARRVLDKWRNFLNLHDL